MIETEEYGRPRLLILSYRSIYIYIYKSGNSRKSIPQVSFFDKQLRSSACQQSAKRAATVRLDNQDMQKMTQMAANMDPSVMATGRRWVGQNSDDKWSFFQAVFRKMLFILLHPQNQFLFMFLFMFFSVFVQPGSMVAFVRQESMMKNMGGAAPAGMDSGQMKEQMKRRWAPNGLKSLVFVADFYEMIWVIWTYGYAVL